MSLDVRSYRIGYVVLEAPDRLLEFGVTRFKKKHVALALARLSRIIQRLKPSALIVRKISPGSTRDTRATRAIVRLAWLHAKRRNMRVAIVREKQIRSHFAVGEATTKYKTALVLVKEFPGLQWKLPPPRKAWKREHPNMLIFDAAALAATYLAKTRGP